MPLVSKPLGSAEPWKAPSYEEIRQKTFEAFGFYPCLWQIRVVEAILKHDRDVISIAATGSGKTAVSINPNKSHSSGANSCIFSAISSMRKSANFFSEAFNAPKCHPFSISARSRMSWLYFCFIKLLAHAHVFSDDLGCLRKVAKRFDKFPRRSFVHGWLLNVGSFKSSVKKV